MLRSTIVSTVSTGLSAAFALYVAQAPASAQDGGLHEFVEPWGAGQRYQLDVERTVEQRLDGEWQRLDGFDSTWTVECLDFTSTGYMRMRVETGGTRSSLAPADATDALAHRIAGLGDGLTLDVLCDYYGVPERLLHYPDLAEAHARGRARLLDGLAGDPATAAQAPLAAALLPTVDDHAQRVLGILEDWAMPIGYTLDLAEPLEFESYERGSWSTVTYPLDVTYRLESIDRPVGLVGLSRLERGREAPDSIVGSTPELVDDRAAFAPFVVRRATWAFDLRSGVPLEFDELELGEVDGVARRIRTAVRVVDEGAPR